MRSILLRYFFVFTLLNPFIGLSQLSFPIEEYYHHRIYENYVNDSSKNFYATHLSAKPIDYSRTNPTAIFVDSSKQYYWITQKLFKENFLIFKGDDFWCSVDPVIDLEAGHDFQIDSMHYKLWNTRGIRVQASFLNKVSFVTTFYENQAFVPDYQSDLFRSAGEFTVSGNTYKQQNAVVPGYARTKSFKTTGFDFAMAEGHLTLQASKNFLVKFGNGTNFIGAGHRSLLLSDNVLNYPFLKLESNFLNGRIQYQNIYSLMNNLYRLRYFNTPEATYERKIGVFHYLDFAVNSAISIGLFEGTIWKHTDSLGTEIPDFNFLNPIILANTFLKSNVANGFNNISGINLTAKLKNFLFYGQLVFDFKKIAGYQAGFRSYDFVLKNLDFQAEYNFVKSNSYLSENKRDNYSHTNLSLAHPSGAGLNEMVFQINYRYKRWFIQNHTTYSAQFENDSLHLGSSILNPISTIVPDNFTRTKIFFNQTEFGYRFNQHYNLQMYIGFLYRNEMNYYNSNQTNFFYMGVRTRLRNKRFDY